MPYIEPDDNKATSLSKARLTKLSSIIAAVIFVGISAGKEVKALMGPEVKQEVKADVSLTGSPVPEIAAINAKLNDLVEAVKKLQDGRASDVASDLKLQYDIEKLRERTSTNGEDSRFLDLRLRAVEAQMSIRK
jgi:hypothetical protein